MSCDDLDTFTVDWDTLLSSDAVSIMNDIKPSIKIIDGIDERFNSIVLDVPVEAQYKTLGVYKSFYDSVDPDLTFGFTSILWILMNLMITEGNTCQNVIYVKID